MLFGNFYIKDHGKNWLLLARHRRKVWIMLAVLLVIVPGLGYTLYNAMEAVTSDAVMFFIIMVLPISFTAYTLQFLMKNDAIHLDANSGLITRNRMKIGEMSSVTGLRCRAVRGQSENGRKYIDYYTLELMRFNASTIKLVQSKDLSDLSGICYFMDETFGFSNNLDEVMDET